MLPLIRSRLGTQIQRQLGFSSLNRVCLRPFGTPDRRIADGDEDEKLDQGLAQHPVRKSRLPKMQKSRASKPWVKRESEDADSSHREPLNFDFKSEFDDGSAMGTQTSIVIAFPKAVSVKSHGRMHSV